MIQNRNLQAAHVALGPRDEGQRMLESWDTEGVPL